MYEFGLKYVKLQKFGHLDTVVPVPLCLVPVANTFCMLVPAVIEISEISADISPIFRVSANIDTIFP